MAISVALSAWYGQRGAALFSLILATLCVDYFFVEPTHGFSVAASELPYFITFVMLATLIWWFGTVRRRVETELRQAREQLKIEVEERSSLLDLTQDSIFVCDMNFVITYWNRGAEEFYGCKRQTAMGKKSGELLHTVGLEPLEETRARLLEKGEWEGEFTRTKADGSRVTIASRWSLRRDRQGRPAAILEVSNDITARKHWEEEIKALNEELARRSQELEASNKELEAFAYSVSHDLRAPLRHMVGYAELLRKNAATALNEAGQRYLAMILEAAKRMGNLIDDLLAFSRISRVESRTSVVELGPLAQEVVAELQRDIKERHILWKIAPLPVCHGDRSMLRLALVNLLSNAVKFTRTRARAEIEIGCADQDDGEPAVFVRDNGVGFDMKYYNKLFGVFQRLHPTDAFEGTGIGLATVQRILHRHGGRIWAEGAVDRGATFYFSLPKMRRATNEDVGADLARGRRSEGR
jgi:PAS domain S-box-containing protein